jgi:hypothetical protein
MPSWLMGISNGSGNGSGSGEVLAEIAGSPDPAQPISAIVAPAGSTIAGGVLTLSGGGGGEVTQLAITSPAPSSIVDQGPLTVTAEAYPVLLGATVLRIYDGSTLVGTGTLADGAVVTLTELGAHELVARVTAQGATVSSDPVPLTIVDETPSVFVTSPAEGQPITFAEPYYLTATVTPSEHGSLSDVQYAVNGGDWAALPNLAGTVYRIELESPSAPGDIVLVVRARDLTPSAALGTVTALAVPPVVEWSGGYDFATPFASMTSPNTGALTLTIDPSEAEDGTALDLTVPAGAESFVVDVPAGWRLVADIGAAFGTAILDGAISWQRADEWRIFLVVDAAALAVRWSARIIPRALAGLRTWSLSGLTCQVDGATLPAGALTEVDAPDFVPDPNGSGIDVFQGGNGHLEVPVGATLSTVASFSIAWWQRLDTFTLWDPVFPLGFDASSAAFVDLIVYYGGREPMVYANAESYTFDTDLEQVYPQINVVDEYVGGSQADYMARFEEWEHCAVSCVGTTIDFYVNGVRRYQAARDVSALNLTNRLLLGVDATDRDARSSALYMRDLVVDPSTAWNEYQVRAHGRSRPPTTDRRIALIGSSLLSMAITHAPARYRPRLEALLPEYTVIDRPTFDEGIPEIFANDVLAVDGASFRYADMNTHGQYEQLNVLFSQLRSTDIVWVDFGTVVNGTWQWLADNGGFTWLSEDTAIYPGEPLWLGFYREWRDRVVIPAIGRAQRVWIHQQPTGLATERPELPDFCDAIAAQQAIDFGSTSNARWGIVPTRAILGPHPGPNYLDYIHPSSAGTTLLVEYFANEVHLGLPAVP